MDLSSPSDCGTDRESTATQAPQRAGLRSAPASHQPTGVFVVIEMTVLVLVTALAMVAIIVSTSEADRVDPAARTAASADSRTRRAADDAMDMTQGKASDPRRTGLPGLPR